MNSPLKMGRTPQGALKYKLHRFMAMGFLSNPHKKTVRNDFGRPIRKESRRGTRQGLNKVGHRRNPGK